MLTLGPRGHNWPGHTGRITRGQYKTVDISYSDAPGMTKEINVSFKNALSTFCYSYIALDRWLRHSYSERGNLLLPPHGLPADMIHRSIFI